MKTSIAREDLARIAQAIAPEAKTLEGKTILISGGSGFLGNYFIGAFKELNKTLLKNPCRVISIDNFITGSRTALDEKDPQIKHIEADITKPLNIDEPVDYIIHAAGLASPFYYKKYPLETIETTIAGAKNLLDLARKKNAKSFLLFSSSEIYGDPDPRFVPIPETYKGHVSSIGPRACYDESKRLAETICMVHHQLYGIPVKIVRPFNIYGPGMKPDDYRVFPTFITRGLLGNSLPVHGSGVQTRAFCYIADAITGFLKVLLSDKNGEIYNVGNDSEELGMEALANLMVEEIGNGAVVQLIEYPDSYPADEPQRRCPDITKIRAQLGYKPTVNLREGIKRSIAWYKEAFPERFDVKK
ncbi:NAD-dependent epimerase/dehydratase family protein [Candidatus Azambacteria bacterium]|nr:NAD-dependent epimerase/dehydratase family protein [Candidatus Azambacteria bacterium]